MTVYEGYQIFTGGTYCDLVCVVKCGNSHFNDRMFVSSLQEAIKTIDEINIYGEHCPYVVALQEGEGSLLGEVV